MPAALPPRPQPPENYDCCGGGCADCDLRRYVELLKAWLKLEAEQGNALALAGRVKTPHAAVG